MKHDFANARRGAVIKNSGKTRVTIFLDDDVIEFFRRKGSDNGRGYQTEINAFLRRGLGDEAVASRGLAQAGVEILGLRGQMDELIEAVGRIEKTVIVDAKYEQHRSGKRLFVREPQKTAIKTKGASKAFKSA